jgi:hypothetical protein
MTPFDPTLDTLLSDPLVVALMKADRVDPASLRAEFIRIGAELAGRRRSDSGFRRLRASLRPHCGSPSSAAVVGGIW